MPYQRPSTDAKQTGKPGGEESNAGFGGNSGLIGAWIQAEKMIQIALLLPCAGFIGWIIGVGLDRWLHQTWISMASIVLGIVAGLVGAIEMAIASAAGSKREGKSADGTKDGSSGAPS